MPMQIGDETPTPIDTEELFDESNNATGNPEWETGDIVTAEKLNNIEDAINGVNENLNEVYEAFKPTIIVTDNDGTLSRPYIGIEAAFTEWGANVVIERSGSNYTTRLPVFSVGIGPGESRYVTILGMNNNTPSLVTYFASEPSDYPSLPTPQPK